MTTTLADHLRSLPDEALAALLRLRPDLVVPVPADLSALALRAQSRVSVARALDGFDQFTLEILDAARLSRGRTGRHDQPGDDLTLAAGADRPTPPGRPSAGCAPASCSTARSTRCRAPRRRRGLLPVPGRARPARRGARPGARPRWSPTRPGSPHGARRRRRRPGRCSTGSPPARRSARLAGGGDAGSPVRWLVDNALLVAGATAAAVELPREVGLLLRRDTGPARPAAPRTAQDRRDRPRAEGRRLRRRRPGDGGGAAHRGAAGGPRRRAGRRCCAPAASASGSCAGWPAPPGSTRPTAALLLEVAYAAGLVGEAEAHAAPVGRPGTETQVLPTARVRRLAGLLDRPPLDRPRRRLADHDPPARPGRPARRAGPADHRARRPRPSGPARRPPGARCSACSPARRPAPRRPPTSCSTCSTGGRRGAPGAGRAATARCSPRPRCSASPGWARSPRTGRAAARRRRRGARPRRAGGRRPAGHARRGRPRTGRPAERGPGARRPAARTGRPLPGAGRPDRGRPRAARAGRWPPSSRWSPSRSRPAVPASTG